VQHRLTEWLVNNEWEVSEMFGREIIWFAIGEMFVGTERNHEECD